QRRSPAAPSPSRRTNGTSKWRRSRSIPSNWMPTGPRCRSRSTRQFARSRAKGRGAEQIDAAIRKEPGVLVLYAVSEKDNPTHVKVFEIYRDRSAYEAHLGSDHFTKYK